MNFKQILLHILSQTKGFTNFQKDDSLNDLYAKALYYACGGKEKSPKTQEYLQSIFDNLAGNQPQNYFFEPKILSIDKDFNFPTKDKKGDTKTVFEQFKTEYEQIKNFENRAFADTCLALLEKYFSYTPCQIEGLQDVSLYDHIKSVMGLMVCLQESTDKESVLLVGGDISGIQGFIYDIIGKYASKNLKGRSFYLQLLVDAVLEKLLDNLGLCNANIVYASGGGFYFLAPNTKDIIEKLEKQIKEIAENIYTTHKTALHLAIESVEVTKDAFKNELYQNNKLVWDTLIEKINEKHKRKFIYLNEFDSFFEPHEIGGEQERDAITNEELDLEKPIFEILEDSIKPVSKDIVLKNTNRDRKFIAEPTKQQIELGENLRSFEFLITSKKPLKTDLKEYHICDLEVYFYFIKDVKALAKQDFGGEKFTLKAINEIKDTLLGCFDNSPHTYNFMLYGGNDYPVFESLHNEDEVKTFSELAGQREPDKIKKYGKKYTDLIPEISLKRLGILRMDVDGLGAIFGKEGFENQTRTLSKYATLSRNLDLFFKGYLNTIWKENENFKNYSQIIYAGGDDLFIVGRWDILIDFAEKIQQDFDKWTCQNIKLGLSGGLAIVPPKFPIAKGANQAEKAEKSAKNYKFTKDNQELEKNAFAFLGFQKLKKDKENQKILQSQYASLNWKNEFDIVKELKKKLQDFVEKSNNKSILMRIQALEYQRKTQQKNETTQSWRWLFAYDFARFKESFKGQENQAFRTQIDEIKTAIFCNQFEEKSIQSPYDFLELLAIASRWAELENRTKKN